MLGLLLAGTGAGGQDFFSFRGLAGSRGHGAGPGSAAAALDAAIPTSHGGNGLQSKALGREGAAGGMGGPDTSTSLFLFAGKGAQSAVCCVPGSCGTDV